MIRYEEKTTRVSIGLRLVDGFTATSPPRGAITVTEKHSTAKARRTYSGYYYFTGLDNGPVNLQIVSNYYVDTHVSATLPINDNTKLLVDVPLIPNWLYPFPNGVTQVRGQVQTSASPHQPVHHATVTCNDIVTQTDKTGRFVVFFKTVTDEDVMISADNKRYIKSKAGTSTLTFAVKAAGFTDTSTTLDNVEEGRSVSLNAPILMASP